MIHSMALWYTVQGVHFRATRTADVLDARERAPLAANETFFIGKAKDASIFGKKMFLFWVE